MIQEKCDKVNLEKSETLEFVPDCYKNQQCIMKLLIVMHMPIAISLTKCVINPSILILLQFICS